MEPSEYDIMCRVQDTHWWYKGMSRITKGVINRYYAEGRNIRILDAGCGTGAGMAVLKSYGRVFGFDISEHAVSICKARTQNRLAVASLMALPFQNDFFDLVTSFDVLYYEGVRDHEALNEFKRVLAPGGKLLVRVPAFDWLRGVHDLKVSTGHRYTIKELSEKFRKCGLITLFVNYANTLLFPFIAFKRLSERWLFHQEDSDLTFRLGVLEKAFYCCLNMESRIVPKVRLPFGLSLIGLAEKAIKKEEMVDHGKA